MSRPLCRALPAATPGWQALLVLGAAGLAAARTPVPTARPAQRAPKGAASTLEAAKAAGKIRIGYANEAPFATWTASAPR